MATRNSSTRSGSGTARSAAKTQIITMLKGDHKKVKKAFKDFEKLDPQEDPETCQALVEQTLSEIEVHAELEEQVFYPAARSAMKNEDLIEEAEVEHMTAKVLIGQLKDMSTDDEKYGATFKVLGEYINHHVQEEEGEMFKQLTQPGADWDGVLEQMQRQRVQLQEEKGLPPDTEAAPAPAARSTRRPGAARSSQSESRPQAASRKSRSPSSEKK